MELKMKSLDEYIQFHKFYLLTLIIVGVSLTHVQSFILPEIELLLHVLGYREVSS